MAPLHPPPTNSATSALPSSAPYSLHVCNIPTDMGKAGLKNLFAKYGEVTEIFLNAKKPGPNGLLWGRVDFANAIDGQRAMNEVDGDRLKGGLRVREFKAMGDVRRAGSTTGSAADSAEAAEKKDSEDRAKLAEFADKGGVGMEPLPDAARAAVATAQRLVAAQAKALESRAAVGHRPAALRVRRPQLRREDYLLNSDSDAAAAPNDDDEYDAIEAPPPSEASSFTHGRPLMHSGIFPPETCHFCTAEGKVRCTVCFAWYCGVKCQREDWMTYHHQICKEIPGTLVPRQPRQVADPASAEPVAKLNQVAASITAAEKEATAHAAAPAAVAEKEATPAQDRLRRSRPAAEEEEAATPSQVAAPAAATPEKEVQKEIKASEPEARAQAAPTATVTPRQRVEAPGKADTVKMGTKVVGGTKAQSESRRPAAAPTATKPVAATKTTAATETPIVKASRDDEARKPVMLKSMNRVPLAAGDEVAFVDFDCSTDYVVVQKVESFGQLGEMLEIMGELKMPSGKLQPITDPRKGEVLSCKWSGPLGDESFYRASVTRVDSEKKKVEVQFVDFGNRAVESFDSLAALHGKTRTIPLLSHTVKLTGVPRKSLTESKVEQQVAVLRPLLEIPVKVKSIDAPKNDEKPECVLECEDKRTVNDIVAEKVSSETVPVGNVQGEAVGGSYIYDECAAAELAFDASSHVQETAVVLNVVSAGEIFLAAHKAHTTFVETIIEKVSNYGEIREAAGGGGFAPAGGHVCVAQASDKTWYRAVAVEAAADDKMALFFADFGFMEDVPRSKILPAVPEVMNEPFLCNHCVLDGFDTMDVDTRTKVGEMLVESLPMFTDVSVVVAEKKNGIVVVRIPSLAKKVAEIIEIGEMERKLAAKKAALTEKK